MNAVDKELNKNGTQHRFGNIAGLVLNRGILLPLKFSNNRNFQLLYPPHCQAENRYSTFYKNSIVGTKHIQIQDEKTSIKI